MEYEKTADVKDSLLRKCRDTIQKMEIEIKNEKKARKEVEANNEELLNEYLFTKQSYEDLESKWLMIDSEQQEKIDETILLQKKVFELGQYVEKLEMQLEEERRKNDNANGEIEKYSDFIEELQDELKSKQDALTEWNEAVTSVEDKLLEYSQENASLKESLDKYLAQCDELFEQNKKKEKVISELNQTHQDFIEKIAQVLPETGKKHTNFEILTRVEQEKNEFLAVKKEKNTLLVKVKELNEKCECIKNLYENKLKNANESRCELDLELQKVRQKVDQAVQKLLKNKEKTVMLKHDLDLSKQYKEKLEWLETDYESLNSKVKILKQTLKYREQEIIEKNSEFSMMKDHLDSIEESSIKELEFLKNGIQSLKDCFNLEISKNEQEILLKFQSTVSMNSQRENELLEEIQHLRDECNKLKSHYSQIIQYKEEEKCLLEQEKSKLKNSVRELEENSIGDKKYYGEYRKELSENNKNYGKNERLLGEKQNWESLYGKKEQELKILKAKFEARLRKKVQETQEKILLWKNKIREDLYCLKSNLSFHNSEKSYLLVEKIEKTVNMII